MFALRGGQTAAFPRGYAYKQENFNPRFNEARVPEYYIWRTRGDGNVSDEHAANDGRIFSRDNPPVTGHPGQRYNCRCVAEPLELPEVELPDADEMPSEVANDIEYFRPSASGRAESVYPELYLIPSANGVFRIGRYALQWLRDYRSGRLDRLHRAEAARKWKPSSRKSPTKWENQFRNRGWTYDQVRHFILNGKRVKTTNKPKRSNGASRYEIGNDFIVMDDTTHELMQISDKTRPFHKANGGYYE